MSDRRFEGVLTGLAATLMLGVAGCSGASKDDDGSRSSPGDSQVVDSTGSGASGHSSTDSCSAASDCMSEAGSGNGGSVNGGSGGVGQDDPGTSAGGTAAGGAGDMNPVVCANGSVPPDGACPGSVCPPGAQPIASDAECPMGSRCWEPSSGLRCQIDVYTPDLCRSVGGTVVGDPGDGSLLAQGCPGGAITLGQVVPGGDEGALCCKSRTNDPCAAQDATYTGLCKLAPMYYWNGSECEGRSGCSCAGADCAAGFASLEECSAAFSACGGNATSCGGFLGQQCKESEYCAYQPGDLCGAADASSTCEPRPEGCTDDYNPVCGCDGNTYPNACVANSAGTGVLDVGACPNK